MWVILWYLCIGLHKYTDYECKRKMGVDITNPNFGYYKDMWHGMMDVLYRPEKDQGIL